MSQFDPWDGNPSPSVGTTNKWTMNAQAPAPSYKFLNYLDWIIANYAPGATSFADTAFDVHNLTGTSNKVTLKFDLNPATSGDVGIVTKYLSVPRIATEPPVPYHDEIVTKYATQTLYNKSFVGAIFRTNAVVPTSPGNNTSSGGIFYGICTADDNFVTTATLGFGTYSGAILPAAATVGSTVVIVNRTLAPVRVAPFFGNTFDSNTNIEPNAGQGGVQVFPYQSAPFNGVTPVWVAPYSVRTWECLQVGQWKDVSARIWNAPDFQAPTAFDVNQSNIMVYNVTSANTTTFRRWTVASNTQPALIPWSSFILTINGASIGSASYNALRFDLTALGSSTGINNLVVPAPALSTFEMVITTGSQTIKGKLFDNTCLYQGVATGMSATGGSPGQVLTVVAGTPNVVTWATGGGDAHARNVGVVNGLGVIGTNDTCAGLVGGTSSGTATLLVPGDNVVQTDSSGGTNYFQIPSGTAGDSITITNSRYAGGGSTNAILVAPASPAGGNLDQTTSKNLGTLGWIRITCIAPGRWVQMSGGTLV